MADGNADFFVIYNRALNPKAETDDTKLSLAFVTELVEFLESRGHKGHYGDRDSKPGSNVFKQLQENVKGTKKIMLVVTPEFLRNCWATYSGQYAFKQLLDSQETGKLVPIGIDISDNQKLKELNIIDWIHFTQDWVKERNPLKWNVISRLFEQDGPLSKQPAYQEYKYAQEHGDNRLRTENDYLVVQEAQREFLTEGFLQRLGESFPTKWEVFAIKLGVKDETVDQVKVDHSKDVCMQAYKALMSWRKGHAGSEKEKVEDLLSVLDEMGRKDLKHDIEKKYEEFTKSEDSKQGANKGLDEVDMGMSRPGNRVHPVDQEKTSVKHVPPNLRVFGQKQNKGDGEPQHTSYVTREMKAEKMAVIEAKTKPAPVNTPLKIDTVKLQQGPPISLPPPAAVQKHSNDRHQVLSRDSVNIVEAGSHGDQRDSEDSIDGLNNHESNMEQHISATNFQALNMKTPDVRPPIEQISNAAGSNLENQIIDKKYNSQQSLSKDEDLSADVDGSFAFKRPVSLVDKPVVTKPSNLNINPNSQDVPSLIIDSLQAKNNSPDSGCYSRTETPLNEQTIANDNKLPQTANKIEENVDQSQKNKRYQHVGSESNKRNQPLESEKNKRCQPELSEENKSYQSAGSAEMSKNKTDQEKENAPQVEPINAIASHQQIVGQADSTQNPASMNVCNSNSLQVKGELDSTQQSNQDRSPKTTSLGSRVISAVGRALLKPEVAYS